MKATCERSTCSGFGRASPVEGEERKFQTSKLDYTARDVNKCEDRVAILS